MTLTPVTQAKAWWNEIAKWTLIEADDQDAEEGRPEPLSLLVRSGWTLPGEKMEAEEYEILLSTGGPALRITGQLSSGEAETARLEWQDWGTPWTEHRCDTGPILTYARSFYFGD